MWIGLIFGVSGYSEKFQLYSEEISGKKATVVEKQKMIWLYGVDFTDAMWQHYL